MHALIPFPDPEPSVPAIPPCDFDAVLRHATASPDTSAPSFDRRHTSSSSYSRIPRRRFARLRNHLTNMTYHLLDAIALITRIYIRLCILIVSIGLAIYLGMVISMLTRAEPLPPFPSPSCPASTSPATTSLAVARGFKF